MQYLLSLAMLLAACANADARTVQRFSTFTTPFAGHFWETRDLPAAASQCGVYVPATNDFTFVPPKLLPPAVYHYSPIRIRATRSHRPGSVCNYVAYSRFAGRVAPIHDNGPIPVLAPAPISVPIAVSNDDDQFEQAMRAFKNWLDEAWQYTYARGSEYYVKSRDYTYEHPYEVATWTLAVLLILVIRHYRRRIRKLKAELRATRIHNEKMADDLNHAEYRAASAHAYGTGTPKARNDDNGGVALNTLAAVRASHVDASERVAAAYELAFARVADVIGTSEARLIEVVNSALSTIQDVVAAQAKTTASTAELAARTSQIALGNTKDVLESIVGTNDDEDDGDDDEGDY